MIAMITRRVRVLDPTRSAGGFTASAPALTTRLAADTQVGPRNGLQARDRNAIAAHLAVAVAVLGHPVEGLLDVLDGLAGRGRQRKVALTLDGQRVALAALLVELRVARFTLAGDLLGLRGERLRLLEVHLPFGEQLLAQLL